MSAGYVHTRASVILAGAFVTAAVVSHNASDVQYAIGALVGVMVTPDCDVDNGFIAYHYIKRSLGSWAERIWDYIWFFYRRSLKHGSELSHFPIISTLGRITYLFFFAIVLPYLFMGIFVHFDLRYELLWWVGKICQYWKVVVGLMGADTIHFALDIATSDGKFDLDSLLHLSPVPRTRQNRFRRG